MIKPMEHMSHFIRMKAWFMLIFGVLLILNAALLIVPWVIFAGILIIVAAIFMFSAGSCNKKRRR